ncbi:DUF2730 domain-containing protein [Paraglaciecola sp. MB-3u-78]|jgi:hypothetical protein|uniref:DUF2730 domain-containing protein n=1 Tax=Paraglaciecola sp. MB-3u-78 TaxID=2058332 RepID=UPI000C34E087|nr:DUF2730 domain-containing protein [Paraglaciecola sp. MB-3u-78]PKG97231.1 DUF2730 domain-containing protein [Paraglaciecola sp. MB-3u-78]
MKTLFFIAALAGAVYLIMQTPAGKAWLEESEPEVSIQQTAQQEIKKVQQVSIQVAQSLEDKMTEFALRFNQKQQVQIDQLENRIAELENELVMGRIAKKQPLQSVSNNNVTLHPYQQPDEDYADQPLSQNFAVNAPKPDTSVATTNNQLQNNRQARLQDIAEKMEMSSLQALVN